MATNNLSSVRNDLKGARCVYCLGYPDVTVKLEIVDESTVLCPLCGIDAVVPSSQVPDEETLQHWHNLGFSFENTHKQLQESSFNFGPDSTTQTIIDSGIKVAIDISGINITKRITEENVKHKTFVARVKKLKQLIKLSEEERQELKEQSFFYNFDGEFNNEFNNEFTNKFIDIHTKNNLDTEFIGANDKMKRVKKSFSNSKYTGESIRRAVNENIKSSRDRPHLSTEECQRVIQMKMLNEYRERCMAKKKAHTARKNERFLKYRHTKSEIDD